MSLGGGEMSVIPMAKEMVKPGNAIELDRDKAMVEENMEVIVSPRNRALQEHAARKDNIHVRSRWATNC